MKSIKNKFPEKRRFYNRLYPFSFIFFLFINSGYTNAVILKEGAELGKWTMDFDAALGLAEKNTIPVLLDFTGSDWCGWCKIMEKKIFSKSEWMNYARDRIILVKIDFPMDKTIVPEKFKRRNMELQNKFSISGYPTYVILDSDGKTELGRLGASRDPDIAKFKRRVSKIIKKSKGMINSFLKELKPEKAAAFQQLIIQKENLQGQFNKWLESRPATNDSNRQEYFEFYGQLNDLSYQIESIEARHHASKLKPENAVKYLEIHEKLNNEKQALNHWLQSRPENSTQSTHKHNEFQNNIAQLTQRLESFHK